MTVGESIGVAALVLVIADGFYWRWVVGDLIKRIERLERKFPPEE